MDPRNNPYAPGAGSKPPTLVGRDAQIESFGILLERLERGYTEQSMIVTGLRGVGKTVLLDVLREKAEERDWATVEWEVEKNATFASKIAILLRRVLHQIAPRERWSDRIRKVAGIWKSFTIKFNPDGSITAGLDVDALVGCGDSGNLAEDLTDLFVALGEAAREHNTGVVFLPDEIQYLNKIEFEALIMALHKCMRKALPITLVGAGLPQLPRLAGDAKSYSERLFKFPIIDKLDPGTDARIALILPAKNLGVEIDSDSVDFVVDYTEGYPYFLQEYGKFLWDEASNDRIAKEDAVRTRALVESSLDESFFRVRTDRVAELELRYLYAMAELGPEPQRATDVAAQMNRKTQVVGSIKNRLIEKGLLYTTTHGCAAFTVPQFDKHMLRAHPSLGEKQGK